MNHRRPKHVLIYEARNDGEEPVADVLTPESIEESHGASGWFGRRLIQSPQNPVQRLCVSLVVSLQLPDKGIQQGVRTQSNVRIQ